MAKKAELIRLFTMAIEEVLHHVPDKMPKDKLKRVFLGVSVKVSSDRLILFKNKGVTCATCGLEGKYFALERAASDRSYHFNLYSIDKEGDEVLFTKDHIIPKSLGGENAQDNYRTMCLPCNQKKANKIEGLEDL